ncbi:MAG TPA: CdaR family protein [Dissulfurispiraceae bacterium]|nr:CdaR family protein [Dissulfurispiraceae bacterium]
MAKRKMSELFTKNIWLKMLSVLLAATLWIYVSYRGEIEKTVEAPVEFRGIPVGMELVRQNLRKVNVNVQGYEQAVYRLQPNEIRVIIDLSGSKRGENTISIEPGLVRAPRGLKVISIEESSLKVALDETASRVVTVKPYVTGTPERSFELSSVAATPSMVRIEGPRSEVEKITLVRTDPVDMTGVDEDISQNVRLNLNGRGVRAEVQEVSVKLTIRKAHK